VKCRSNPCSLHSDAEHIKAGARDDAMAIAEERERDGAMPTTMPTLTRSRSSATGAATVKSAPNPVTAPTPAPTGVDMLDQDQRPTAREMLDAADDRGLDVTIGGDAPSYYDEYDEPLDPPEHSFLTSPHGQSRGGGGFQALMRHAPPAQRPGGVLRSRWLQGQVLPW
jgi:hypothetical protein